MRRREAQRTLLYRTLSSASPKKTHSEIRSRRGRFPLGRDETKVQRIRSENLRLCSRGQRYLCAEYRGHFALQPCDDLLPGLGRVLRRQRPVRRLEGQRVGQALLAGAAPAHPGRRRTAARRPATSRPTGGSAPATCAAGTASSTISARSSKTAGCDEKAVHLLLRAPTGHQRRPGRVPSRSPGRFGRSKLRPHLRVQLADQADLDARSPAPSPSCRGAVRGGFGAGRSHDDIRRRPAARSAPRARP